MLYTLLYKSSKNNQLINNNLLFFFLFLNYWLSAQPIIEWEKNYGGTNTEAVYSIQQTTDEGYIIAGITHSTDGDVEANNGEYDAWIVKLSPIGNIEWKKNYGDIGSDYARSIQQTLDGGYIIAGQTKLNDDHIQIVDCWILKLDEFGNLEWEKKYGNNTWTDASSVQQTIDGGYIVAGRAGSGYTNYWMLKLDELGNLKWEKNYGGSDVDGVNSIIQTTDGGYIVGGYAYSNNGDVGANNGESDYWIVKLDDWGNIQWEKNYGGFYAEYAYSIIQTTDGGYMVAGESWSNDGDVGANNGESDCWVVKLDEFGNIQWEKNYGGTNRDAAVSIHQTTDGGYVLAGSSKSNAEDPVGSYGYYIHYDYYILKLDETGNVQWEENYGGTYRDAARSIQQTLDGGYIVAGFSASSDGDVGGNNGGWDYWIVKLGSDNFNCLPNLNITTNTPFQNLYQSSGTITTNGNLNIWQNQQVEYRSNHIKLNEGFSAKAGSHFKVRYGGCN